VSSDPFADLARTLEECGAALGELLHSSLQAAPGSIAAAEANPERYGGEWSMHPGSDALSGVAMLTWAAIDHLAATAALIRAQRIASPHTTARAVAESCARACYLAEPGIEPLERVRRVMNYRLDSLCHVIVMLREAPVPGATGQLAEKQARVAAVMRAGRHYGLQFHPQKNLRPAWLGTGKDQEPPGATRLIDACASATPGLGRFYQQILSSVTHGSVWGLSQFLRSRLLLDGAPPGQVLTQPSITSLDMARNLLAAPLCVSTLTERLRDYAGWDISPLGPPVARMLTAWGRVAQIPYPGPLLAPRPEGPPPAGR
jgi:hypothetical protein